MPTKKLIIPTEYKKVLDEIDKMPYSWATQSMKEHPDLSDFNRSLVVSGFSAPDMESENSTRIYLFLKQILVHKTTGRIFKTNQIEPIELSTYKPLEFRNPDKFTEIVRVPEQTIDDDGETVLNTENVTIPLNRARYTKYLIVGKKIALTEALVDFLKTYIADFSEELDRL